MWCVAELNEDYIRRMEDILAVYEKPLTEREPVVCMDEKPVVLHQEVRPPRAVRPGQVARRDGEYRRCGRKPDDTSPKSRLIAPRPTSQTTCWMSPLAIPKPTPFTWCWTI